MSEHTKGPWTIHSYPEEHFVEVKGNEGYQVVATVRFAGGDRDANASLISAAPELLEVLQYLVAPFDGIDVVSDGLIAKARAAIAKAVAAPSAPIR